MVLELHTIKPSPKSRQKSKRLGRGNSSQKGNYSGKGMKGQRARSGGKGGLRRIGFKQSLQRIPKVRGFKSEYPKPETITLSQLNLAAGEVELVTPEILKEMRLVKNIGNGVKILANGEVTKKVSVQGCLVSSKAKEMIEKVGGSIL